MSRALHLIISLAIALVIGAWSARVTIASWPAIAAEQYGVWRILPELGQQTASPYSKAYQHLAPRMFLGTTEGAIFTASEDDQGRPLNPLCSYRLEGEIALAALFTLHAISADGAWIRASDNQKGWLHSDELLYRGDQYVIEVAASARPGNWLAINSFAPFTLVMTQYDVSVVNDQTVQRPRLPTIVETGCGNA